MKDPNARNKMENSTGKGWSPPSGGNMTPPAAGVHKPVGGTHRIQGDAGGPQGPGVHESLRKPSK